MVNMSGPAGQVAPPPLEPVRGLLNSWLIPNDSREPTDRFDELARAGGWRGHVASLVRELRDDLRQVVESDDPGVLNKWIDRVALRLVVADGAITYQHERGPAGEIVAAVVSAVGDGSWKRLKACPDCHWVFYDNTRNGSKRWCLMYAGGPDGRACGTIAKVRRYRDRQVPAAAD
jgi:predicted RNA-binding Zn ribbon-like protein